MPRLPEHAADTTAEQPWPLRTLSMKIGDYVDKMSPVWVEGQIVQLTRRPGAATAYLTLRDTQVDMSMSVTVHVNTLDAMGPAVAQGARVVVHAKAVLWGKNGSLHLDARQLRAVGVGELLARLEHLKQLLRSEGLFDPGRKRPLPFLPRTVGLICGRASAAEKDVVENARRRWPATTFEIRQVAVQGQDTVPQVTAALRELDSRPDVDVIVIARGGGSFEDLLAFSNETLLRAVSAAHTPVVSAIGHDSDTPLLDFVADQRASTPTDAAKLIVPDLHLELQQLSRAVDRGRDALRRRLLHERTHLQALASRPVLVDPASMVNPRRDEIERLRTQAAYRLLDRVSTAQRDVETMRTQAAYRITDRVDRSRDQIEHTRAQLRAFSPQQTLERGYAVVRQRDGRVVTDVEQVEADQLLRVTVAHGDFAVRPVT